MSVTKYKLGGKTECSHPYCPARVLLGGRCKKACPLYEDCGGVSPAAILGIDHVGLGRLPDGSNVFFTCSHCYPDRFEANLRKYCNFYHLTYKVERGSEVPFQLRRYSVRVSIGVVQGNDITG